MKADLIFVTSKKGLLKRAIAWLTESKGESPSKAVHVAAETDMNSVIEALLVVKTTPLKEWKSDHKDYEVWRNVGWSSNDAQAVCDVLWEYQGKPYGFWKLLIIALDLIIGKFWGKGVFIFRRLLFSNSWPICSWIYTYAAFSAIGYRFGIDPHLTDPDQMRDFCLGSQDWKIVNQ